MSLDTIKKDDQLNLDNKTSTQHFDAFTAGIDPGGLRTQSEIKLLICYIISSIGSGIAKNDIVTVFQENGLANYFEVNNAFSDLIDNNNIKGKDDNPDLYILTSTGKMIATQLESSLPLSIREQALSATINLIAKVKSQNENRVEIIPENNGYKLICHISDGTIDLMSLSIFVPDILQAELVKKNFHNNPGVVYRALLALVTGHKDMLEDILK